MCDIWLWALADGTSTLTLLASSALSSCDRSSSLAHSQRLRPYSCLLKCCLGGMVDVAPIVRRQRWSVGQLGWWRGGGGGPNMPFYLELFGSVSQLFTFRVPTRFFLVLLRVDSRIFYLYSVGPTRTSWQNMRTSSQSRLRCPSTIR